MTLPRRVDPELLDELLPDDPRAIEARRGLRRLNAVTLHGGAMARALLKYHPNETPRVLLELGAGDGSAMLRVARRLAPRWSNVTVIMLDQRDIVDGMTREAFAALRWRVETVAADVFDFLRQTKPSSVDIIAANLFLHHFEREQLGDLLAAAARATTVFVAREPQRTKVAREISRMLWLIGLTDINCYDAVVSVRAGFRDQELSALWPQQERWELHERSPGYFLHYFAARRLDGGKVQ